MACLYKITHDKLYKFRLDATFLSHSLSPNPADFESLSAWKYAMKVGDGPVTSKPSFFILMNLFIYLITF